MNYIHSEHDLDTIRPRGKTIRQRESPVILSMIFTP